MLYRYGGQSLTSPELAKDAAGFWKVAIQYYNGDYSRIYTPFPYVLNAEFQIFGINIICCITINIALSMIMALLYFSLMNKLNIYGNARFWGGMLVCFFPYSFNLSTSLWRESIYLCFLIASVVVYSDYITTGKQRYFYSSLVLICPVLFMHIGYFPVVLVYIFDAFKHEKIHSRKQLFYRCVQVALIIGFIIVASNFSSVSYLTGKTGGIEGIINKLVGSTPGETTLEAGSRYLHGIQINSFGTLILYAPLKWFFYLFSPLPMNWRGLIDIISFVLDGLVHFIILALGTKNIYRANKRVLNNTEEKLLRICKVAFWSVILCACVFGLGTSTAGTAMRHRGVMIGIEAIILSIALFSEKH